MSDFDPDAYLAQSSGDSAPSFDPDHYLAQSPSPSEVPKKPTSPIDRYVVADEDNYASQGLHAMLDSAGHSILGGYKGLYTLATTGDADAAADAVRREEAKAYRPDAPVTAALSSPANPMTWPGRVSGALGEWSQEHGASPGGAATVETVGNLAGMVLGSEFLPKEARPVQTEGAPMSAEEVLAAQARNSKQSMGAASATPALTEASPALKDRIIMASRQNAGPVNPDALNRQLEADRLPVKMQLTRGQATQDPSILSDEQNARGTQPELAQRFNDQNRQLSENIQALRDSIGPDVFSANTVEHGQKLIDAYQAKNGAAQADIAAKYQALKDANGGKFPVDAKALLDNASSALHDELLFDHAPAPVMSTLKRLADQNNMTFENFESLRTNLARIQRSATDGNERAAAGVIRNAMENLPLSSDAAKLKPLADAARTAARNQFQALETDPAYKAAVNESVPPDRFVNRFIVNGNRDDLATMRQNLAEDPAAQQTMGVAALDHLKRSARLDDFGNGNFSQSGYNKALQQLQPKLSSLVSPEHAETLNTLGNVARYTQAQPRGSYVNNSNTFVAGAKSAIAGSAEGAANVAFGGVPVGTWARKGLGKLSESRDLKRTLEPGAGIADLPVPRQ